MRVIHLALSILAASWHELFWTLSAVRCCAVLRSFAGRWVLPFEIVLGSQSAPEMKGAVGTPMHFTWLNSFVLLIIHYPVGNNFKVLFLSKTLSPLSLKYAQSQFPEGLNFFFLFECIVFQSYFMIRPGSLAVESVTIQMCLWAYFS